MPAPRDAAATRARILDAAVTEFARAGFAGGRVDRIAQGASANVRMIYAYFGDKSGLFDAALTAAITRMAAAVPLDPSDLPGWAGRLFDWHRAHPEPLRINMWAQLERPEAASEPLETYLAKTAALAGDGARGPAVDALVLVYAVTQAWFLTPTGLLESDGSRATDPQRIAAHRAAVVEAVRRITAS